MRTFILLAATPLLLLAHPAGAGDFDPTRPFLCAVTETVHCSHAGDCSRGGAEDIDFPAFIEVEIGKKLIRERGGERSTQISNQRRAAGQLVLQGVQNERAWSFSLIESTGKMAITAASGDVGYMVFGACTGL